MTSLVPFTPTPSVAEFADILIDSAILLIDGTQLTLSRGGWMFDPGEEWEDYPYPGRTMNTVGCRELVRLKPVIKGSALLSGEDQITAYRPDGTWADHASITGARTFTPNDLRTYLGADEYLENVVCLWKRQRGDFIAVEFPVAICGQWNLGATDGDEGLFQIVIEAVQDYPATGTTKDRLPYRIRKTPVGDTPTEPPEEPLVVPKLDLNAMDPINGGYASGASVPTWADRSGYDNDAAVNNGTWGQTAPTYQANGLGTGLPSVRTDGVSQGLTIPQLPTVTSQTWYLVFAAPTPDDYAYIFQANQGPENIQFKLRPDRKTEWIAFQNIGGEDKVISTDPLPDGICLVRLTFEKPGGVLKLHHFGVLQGTASCNPQFLTDTFDVLFGERSGGDGFPVAADFGRVLCYEGAHDDDTAETIEAALRDQWGIP